MASYPSSVIHPSTLLFRLHNSPNLKKRNREKPLPASNPPAHTHTRAATHCTAHPTQLTSHVQQQQCMFTA